MGPTKLLALVTALLIAVFPAMAQWEPSGPITLEIGFDAGGETDTLGRIIAREVEEQSGWNIVAENKPGGGGIAVFSSLAVQKPDGLTIGLGVSMPVLVNLLLRGEELPFDLDSFDYLATVAHGQIAIITRADQPFNDMQGLVEYSKQNDGALIAVVAKPQELLMRYVGKQAGTEFKLVTAKSSAEAIQNLLGGHVDAAFAAGGHIPYMESGDVKMIASANAERHSYAPDTLTVREQGFDIDVDPYFYLAAPAGLSDGAKAALSKALDDAINSEDARKVIIETLSTDPNNLGPDGTKKMMVEGLDNVAKLFGK